MLGAVYEGLTVIELADRRNQYAGKLLSDAGARVIQVEPPDGGPGRSCGPFVDDRPDPNGCLDYWYYNTGKESVALDVSRPAGREMLRRLIAQADIFLESTRPGRMAAWGLDYDSLAQESLLHVSVTDFGQDGPWKDNLANDVCHLALGGQMAISGYSDPEAPPIGGQGHQAWHITGVLCVQAITVALMESLGSGRGQYIDCSIHDCCSICTELPIPRWVYMSQHLYRQTAMHARPQRQPPETLPTADGRHVNTVGTDIGAHHWVALIKRMQELAVVGELEDPKYTDPETRMREFRDGSAIREGIGRLIAAMPGEEAMHWAQSNYWAWGVVRAPEENLEDPHWNERGYFEPVSHPGIDGPVRYPRAPFLSGEPRMGPRRRAPDLGEHTETVLTELAGLDGAQIAALRESRVAR